MEDFGKFVWSILILVVGVVTGGFVVMKLWNWLLVPSMGFDQLMFIHGVAISVFVGFFKIKSPGADEGRESIEQINKRTGKVLIIYALYLLVGWVVSLFM